MELFLFYEVTILMFIIQHLITIQPRVVDIFLSGLKSRTNPDSDMEPQHFQPAGPNSCAGRHHTGPLWSSLKYRPLPCTVR